MGPFASPVPPALLCICRQFDKLIHKKIQQQAISQPTERRIISLGKKFPLFGTIVCKETSRQTRQKALSCMAVRYGALGGGMTLKNGARIPHLFFMIIPVPMQQLDSDVGIFLNLGGPVVMWGGGTICPLWFRYG